MNTENAIKQVLVHCAKNSSKDATNLFKCLINMLSRNIDDISFVEINNVTTSIEVLNVGQKTLIPPITAYIVECLRTCNLHNHFTEEVNFFLDAYYNNKYRQSWHNSNIGITYHAYITYLRQKGKRHFSSCEEIANVYVEYFFTKYTTEQETILSDIFLSDFLVHILVRSFCWTETIMGHRFWEFGYRNYLAIVKQANLSQLFNTYVLQQLNKNNISKANNSEKNLI